MTKAPNEWSYAGSGYLGPTKAFSIKDVATYQGCGATLSVLPFAGRRTGGHRVCLQNGARSRYRISERADREARDDS